MKAYKILIFLFSVIALLGCLCAFYPAGGVPVFGTTLRFPTLTEVLEGAKEEEYEAPEDFIARREAELQQMQQSSYMAFFRSDSARFILPNNDISWFDPVFEAFENADKQHVRIVHYGDSQIEEDRVSKTIRKRLQEKFGGGGPGLVPLKGPYYTYSISESITRSPKQYTIYFPDGARLGNNRYGPWGNAARVDTVFTSTYTSVKKGDIPPAAYFNRATIVSGNAKSGIYVRYGKEKLEIKSEAELNMDTIELPDSTSRLSLTFSGYGDVYGVMLDNENGISLDNVPMRGSGGTIFTKISANQLKQFYADANVKLIIMQYGGNVVPYTKTNNSTSVYVQNVKKQIEYLQSTAPEAKILFIGPSDMSTSKNGKMVTYPHLPALIDSLQVTATKAGAAFWNLYSAMGGEDSMAHWVKANPSLAGPDYVHFTPRGAELMGEMFSNSLMVYYDYYEWRKKHGK